MNLDAAFDRLDANGIGEFIRLGQEEHLSLEFKTIVNANLSRHDDKRTLAIWLSGFGNSSGGIVVWGVDARKNDQGIDVARRSVEITPIRLLVSRLNELTGVAVSPIVDGVRHKAIETSQDRGFAASLVPESESGPHMAKLGEDRYYKRSSDSFYRMEPFDIEDMSGRRQKPRLTVQLRHVLAKADNTQEELHFSFHNSGRAIAKHAGLFAQLDNVDIVQVAGALQNVSSLNEGRSIVSHVDNIGVIHPHGISVHIGYVQFRRSLPDKPIVVEVKSYCEYVRPSIARIEFAPIHLASQQVMPS